MNALAMLNRGTNVVAILLCVGLAFIIIYCVCFCLYAAFAVSMDYVNANASVDQCIADMIRAPFFLLLGPLSSFEGNPPPSPHPQILGIAVAAAVALTTIAYRVKRRGSGRVSHPKAVEDLQHDKR